MSLLPKWWKDFSFDQPIFFFLLRFQEKKLPDLIWGPITELKTHLFARGSFTNNPLSIIISKSPSVSKSLNFAYVKSKWDVERDFLAMLGKHNESLWRLKCWWYFCGGHGLILGAKSLEAHLCFKFVFFNLSQSSPILTTLDYFR